MREIKFRAYKNHWIYGSAVQYGEHTGWWILEDGQDNQWGTVDYVDQYTGIKDKEGNEIYENDLIINKYGITRVVKFYEGCFVLINQGDLPDVREDLLAMQIYDELKVVGNIYERD